MNNNNNNDDNILTELKELKREVEQATEDFDQKVTRAINNLEPELDGLSDDFDEMNEELAEGQKKDLAAVSVAADKYLAEE